MTGANVANLKEDGNRRLEATAKATCLHEFPALGHSGFQLVAH
jgi:hypothetical protein